MYGRNYMKPIHLTLPTSKLLSRIRRAKSPEEALAWHKEAGEPAFQDVLYDLLEEKGLKPKEMIQRCQLGRSYFYHILSGKKIPSRNMVLRLCLCAGANLEQTGRLLRLAGCAGLYPKLRRDALLIFALEQQMDMHRANTLLLEEGETPLCREDKL